MWTNFERFVGGFPFWLRHRFGSRHVEGGLIGDFIVPLKIRLERLHDVIQVAMGWTDAHLYEFRMGDVGLGVPDQTGSATALCS